MGIDRLESSISSLNFQDQTAELHCADSVTLGKNETAKMIRTVAAIIDDKGQVSLLEPVRLSSARRALVTIFEEEPVAATALLSETALSEEWERPEEDAAWANL